MTYASGKSPLALRMLRSFAFLSLLAVSDLSIGHHSVGAVYDMRQTITLAGELSAIDWRNPHVELVIKVDGGSEYETVWRLQGPSPGFFRDGEFTRDRFERSIGQVVTVEAHPARSGPGRAAMLQIAFPDNAVLEMDPSC